MRLSLDRITLDIAKNTAKKARSYMQAYTSAFGNSHLLIEKFVKIHKCQRNIIDEETAYLDKVRVKIEENVREIEKEKVLVARDKKEREHAKAMESEKLRMQREKSESAVAENVENPTSQSKTKMKTKTKRVRLSIAEKES